MPNFQTFLSIFQDLEWPIKEKRETYNENMCNNVPVNKNKFLHSIGMFSAQLLRYDLLRCDMLEVFFFFSSIIISTAKLRQRDRYRRDRNSFRNLSSNDFNDWFLIKFYDELWYSIVMNVCMGVSCLRFQQ